MKNIKRFTVVFAVVVTLTTITSIFAQQNNGYTPGGGEQSGKRATKWKLY